MELFWKQNKMVTSNTYNIHEIFVDMSNENWDGCVLW